MPDRNEQFKTIADIVDDLSVAAKLLDQRRYPGNAWADAKLRRHRRGGSMAKYFIAAGSVAAAAAIVIAVATTFVSSPVMTPIATPSPKVAAATDSTPAETSIAMIGSDGLLDLLAGDLSLPQTDTLTISNAVPTITTPAIWLPETDETNAFELVVPSITLPSNERSLGNES